LDRHEHGLGWLGGALGSIARYGIGRLIKRKIRRLRSSRDGL
jgi:hypothetical protein